MGELLMRRREMMKQGGGGGGGRLPAEYQEVEWFGVRNTTTKPTAYITLDSVLPAAGTIYAEVKPFSLFSGTENAPLGTISSRGNTEIYYTAATALKIYGGVYSNFQYSIGSEWDSFSFKQSSVTVGVNLLMYRTERYAFDGKMRVARITNSSGVVIHDYVPCYRKADGEIGVYDIIANSFHTNSGTGTLVKGNDV